MQLYCSNGCIAVEPVVGAEHQHRAFRSLHTYTQLRGLGQRTFSRQINTVQLLRPRKARFVELPFWCKKKPQSDVVVAVFQEVEVLQGRNA